MGLRGLREALNKRDEKTIPTEKLLKMAEFVLKNNYFKFGNKIKQQISGTTIGTKFAPPYACIFMSDLETKFQNSKRVSTYNLYYGYGILMIFFSSGPMVKRVLRNL